MCSKNEDELLGKTQELIVFEKIKKFFITDTILQTKYKYSSFDYFGLSSNYLYELKTNRNAFSEFPNAIIGIEKVLNYKKQIFLFQFQSHSKDTFDLYYFIKPKNFKEKYKIIEIYLKAREKMNLVYEIPRSELLEMRENETLNLPIINQNEVFNKLIELDRMKALQ
jgi:hypothetical protein